MRQTTIKKKETLPVFDPSLVLDIFHPKHHVSLTLFYVGLVALCALPVVMVITVALYAINKPPHKRAVLWLVACGVVSAIVSTVAIISMAFTSVTFSIVEKHVDPVAQSLMSEQGNIFNLSDDVTKTLETQKNITG